MPKLPITLDLPSFLDGHASQDEIDFARNVLVPGVAAVSALALGVGVAKACFGVRYRDFDRHGVLPVAMAAVTSAVAVWSYFNPQPAREIRRAIRREVEATL